MKNTGRFLGSDGDRARRRPDAGAGRVRLPPRRLYLSNAPARRAGGHRRLRALPTPP